jgi:hypothetical protein
MSKVAAAITSPATKATNLNQPCEPDMAHRDETGWLVRSWPSEARAAYP